MPASGWEVFSSLLLSTAFVTPFQDMLVLSLPNLSGTLIILLISMDAPSRLAEVNPPTIPPVLHICETFHPSDECDIYMMPTLFELSFQNPTIILLSMPTNILNFRCRHHIRHQGRLPGYLFHTISQCLDILAGIF